MHSPAPSRGVPRVGQIIYSAPFAREVAHEKQVVLDVDHSLGFRGIGDDGPEATLHKTADTKEAH